MPHVAVSNVDALDFDALRAAGVASIIFDKDNTLTAPYVDTAHADMADSIKRAKDAFGADNCIVLSNSAGSGDDAPEYTAAKACEAALGLRVARHPDAQKPQCLEGVVASLPASGRFHGSRRRRPPRDGRPRSERNRGAQRAHAAARYEGRQPRRLVITLPREPAAPAFVKAPRGRASYAPGRRGPRARSRGRPRLPSLRGDET